MTGSDIIKMSREKHIKEVENNKELNAMRFVIQYQNGKTYIYKFNSPSLNAIKKININDVIMAQVISGFCPTTNRENFIPMIYNLVYIQERFEVQYEEEE